MGKRDLTYLVVVLTILLTTILILGSLGCSGKDGNNGSDGAKGPKGDSGQPGVSPPPPQVGAAPATLAECSSGGVHISVNGIDTIICNGINGSNGTNGNNGNNGTNGTDATVTFIQLCPGITPTYPSTFPEVGVCVNNVLYAVYSANGGFLTEVTPGTYSSNGINASCTFTVLSGCMVTQ
jgi:hypothetical protein